MRVHVNELKCKLDLNVNALESVFQECYVRNLLIELLKIETIFDLLSLIKISH